MKFFAPEGVQNVVHALALESRMLEDPAGEEGLLFCWSGERAVVLGKNQNPWRECNLNFIREQGCKLARRVSGGGTVYHDPGNVNISWILPRDTYRAGEMHGILIRALNQLGLPAEQGSGGSLIAMGKKISGSAFCYRKDRVLHHGTLLLNADLGALRSALSHPHMRIETHAVDSVPASVLNLKTLNPEMNRQRIEESLCLEAEKVFGPLEPLGELPDVDSEMARLSTDEWIWTQTPAFSSQMALPGDLQMQFKVRKGKLTECRVGDVVIALDKSPDFPTGDFGELERRLGLAAGTVGGLFAKNGWVRV